MGHFDERTYLTAYSNKTVYTIIVERFLALTRVTGLPIISTPRAKSTPSLIKLLGHPILKLTLLYAASLFQDFHVDQAVIVVYRYCGISRVH